MKTGVFKHYVNDTQHPCSFNTGNTYGGLVIDAKGIILIATSHSLSSFDPEKNSFRLFTHDPNDSVTIQCNYITQIEKDKAGNLWLAMEEDGTEIVDYFNSRTAKVIQHMNGQSLLPPKLVEPIQYIMVRGRNGNIWFATEKKRRIQL
jgi:ligand-binding sensor domain-containing protein